MLNWIERLKFRWKMRNSSTAFSEIPGTQQHYRKTADDRFKEAKGFSAATTPLPWGEDISKHNAEVEKEYAAEVEARKAAFIEGTYHPQFLDVEGMSDTRLEAIVEDGHPPTVNEINWVLEMSARPGARVNVTKETGVPMQPILTPTEEYDARMAGSMAREVAALEQGHQAPTWKTPRDFIGSRASILKAVGGDEQLADRVEDSARKMFGVENLDEPLAKA